MGLTSSQLQSLLGALRGTDMGQLRDLADVKNTSQLERLVPGIGAIKIYSDGSASIKSANGSTEHINSACRIVDANGGAKEPLPDSQASSNRTPNPNRDGGGTGGGVAELREAIRIAVEEVGGPIGVR